MTTPREPELTDELLSAYIDNAVTPEERHIVEQAAADDPDVAWRLQSLQMTVHLLHELPALALPRSFLLTPEQVNEQVAGSVATQPTPISQAPAPRRTVQPGQPGFWVRLVAGWRTFWQSGSPALRNAMATSLVLLFVFLVAPRLLTEPLGSIDVAPAAAPTVELAPGPTVTLTLEAHAVPAVGAARIAAPAPAAAESAASPVVLRMMPERGIGAGASAVPGPTLVAAEPAMAISAAALSVAAEESVPAANDAMAAAAAPPVAVEAAAVALSAAGAGPALDQSPAQGADPLAAVRAVVPPGAEARSGPPAPAMAAPAEVVSPLPTVAPPAATSIPTPTPTVAPTATPTPLPAATATVAATVASVAIEQAAPDARILPTVATRPRSAPVAALPWLPIAQLVATAGFLLFGLLWWRSRR